MNFTIKSILFRQLFKEELFRNLHHENNSTVNACIIKKESSENNYMKESMQKRLHLIESILLTRLKDDTVRGVINLYKMTIPDTPIDEIENALVS